MFLHIDQYILDMDSNLKMSFFLRDHMCACVFLFKV